MCRCLLLLFAGLPAAADPAGGAEPGKQTPARLETSVPVTLDYLIYLPPDYARQDAWPLLLFLHGAGERGENLQLVKKHGPPKLIEQGRTMPFVVVSPQCPAGRWWEPVSLTALLDQITANYHIDEDRIYVTGLSMGGFGTWSLAAYAPERFAAIAPICGGGDPIWARRLAHLPVWIFHGAQDRVVPVERSKEMAEALKGRGAAEVKLTIYPEAGHDAWTATYADPELYRWLLAHRRRAGGS